MQHREAFELALAELLASDDDLTEQVVRLRGATSNDAANAMSVLAVEIAFRLFARMLAKFFDTAKGDDLTRYVTSEFGVPREGATAAVVPLLFSRSALGPLAAGTIAAGTPVTIDGQTFTTDTPVYWSAGNSSDKPVFATAVEVGPSGNVPVGEAVPRSIDVALFDTTITFTNTAVGAGGNNEEEDDDYKARTRDMLARLVRATLQAIVIGALDVPGVRTASAYESVDSSGYPSGSVALAYADAGGNSNAAMTAAVLANLREYRPAGIPVRGTPGVVRYEPITVAMDWKPNEATPENAELVRQLVVARVNRLVPRSEPAGATPNAACQLRQSVVHEAIGVVRGSNGGTVTIPVGTVTPNPGEVIRTREDLVTVV